MMKTNIIKKVTILDKESTRNIRFLLFKVWQESEAAIEVESLSDIIRKSSENDINPSLPVFGLCYADQKHFHCVFPNGRIGKCDNESPGSAIGSISDEKVIINICENQKRVKSSLL